jgi:hypothetical protein
MKSCTFSAHSIKALRLLVGVHIVHDDGVKDVCDLVWRDKSKPVQHLHKVVKLCAVVHESEETFGLDVSPDGLLLVEITSLDADVGEDIPRGIENPFLKV